MTGESGASTGGVGVRIGSLADHPELVEGLARWHDREWGRGEAAWTVALTARSGADTVPFTLVAFLGDEPVGCVSLTHDDVDPEFAAHGPWLSGMIVVSGARDLGIGRRLLGEVEARAVALGHTELWAHTQEAERFYVRCGWEVVRPKVPLHRDAVVRRTLPSGA